MEVTQGEIVTLTCTVTKEGETPVWTRNGEALVEDKEKYELITDGLTVSLIMHNAILSDQAEYKCSYGEDTTSCRLLVQGITLFYLL